MKTYYIRFFYVIICLIINSASAQVLPVNFSKVVINDPFWNPIIQKVSTVTIDACVNYTENKTGRIRNFEKVAAKKGTHEGIFFDDSDVYKALEAIAYSLKNNPNPELEKKADSWINKIAAAQQPDGYINTYFTLTGLDKRWTDMDKHETYCAGHLLEAGLAYYDATNKKTLLDVAIRMVNHIDSNFKAKNIPWVSGHEEIELALVKLYHATGEKKYLDLAEYFVEQRGRGYYVGEKRESPKYDQNDVPFADQRKVEGHAVRAMYLYSAAADITASKQNTKYIPALDSIWDNLIKKNMYVTGGIGSSGSNEGFSQDYDLPNESAYCETCASVGMILWNQRMNMLKGESKYIDVLERTLYNGALDGLSLSGDKFFYGNPLASSCNKERQSWFGCACCPSNIARLVLSVGGYIYSTSKNNDAIYINLFISSKTDIPVKKDIVSIEQKCTYPWDGQINVTISPTKKIKQKLFIRIPGWATNNPVPYDLYTYLRKQNNKIEILLNGKITSHSEEKGYAVIEREWVKGDKITFVLPMNIEKVIANEQVKENVNKVALQRGPIVYCFEEVGSKESVKGVVIPPDTKFNATFNPQLLGGVVTITGQVPAFVIDENGHSISTETKTLTFIPYYSWANRGKSDMSVWNPISVTGIKLIAK